VNRSTQATAPDLRRFQRPAWLAGAVAAVLALVGLLLAGEAFFQAYLMAYLFWLGIALGCLGVVLLQNTAGGHWGAVLRRICEAGARTMPLLALLFVPLALGLPQLYEWAHAQGEVENPALAFRMAYLATPFFLLRAVIYFAVWILLGHFSTRWSIERDRSADPALTGRLRALGAAGLVLFVLTTTFAAVDWVMTLEPEWLSSILGLVVSMAQVLTGFAFAVALASWLGASPPLARAVSPKIYNDLGSLLLAFVMIWAYLPEEVTWYVRRTQGAWQGVALFVVFLGFALPFVLLVNRDVKRNRRLLGLVALLILPVQLVNFWWMTRPALNEGRFSLHWLDLVLPVALGGIWLAFYIWNLARWPLLPVHDPALHEETELAHEHA
jgi:hypothetical protein